MQSPFEAQVAGMVITETEQKILILRQNGPLVNKEIIHEFGYKSLSGNVKKALNQLKKIQAIVYTIPVKPNSQHQKYKSTEISVNILEELKNKPL
jgi:hypothetical protein